MSTFRPDPLAYLTGRLEGTERPSAISYPGGGKFDPEGRILPYPGNTIVCHIDRASTAYRAFVQTQHALMAGPHADNFSYLPPESFHMTMFEGISGANPRPSVWPDGIPQSASRDEVSAELLNRLQDLEVPADRRVRPVGLFGGYSVTLDGADMQAEDALRETRSKLRDATAIRPPDFDTYTFHVSLAYVVRWLDEKAAREVIALSDEIHACLAEKVPCIELGPLEFCEFENMHHFEPIRLIGEATTPRNGGPNRGAVC